MNSKPIRYNELNCIIIDDEPHALAELEELIDTVPGVKLSRSFSNAREAISFLDQNGEVDVIFSDINMPGLSGIDAAEMLQRYCNFLIYVTAYRDYALDAIRAKVRGYLMKPLSYVDFAKQIMEIRSELSFHSLRNDNFIFLKGDHKNNFKKVNCEEIVYIKALLNYVQVFTGKDEHMTYSLLGDVERELSYTNLFIRISKSIIISLLHLEMVEGNVVFLNNGLSFPVGIPYRERLTAFLKNRHVGSVRKKRD
ncbi:LytTR family DNA-binding domain-containing protein [Pedobacter sp. G11]|uniref:LytR/AlgR family response regulator transcription factor n=1 Tax=Pedobacter sp. G11 TaxID=2482728 RepID=UPI00143DE993|nr:response regulator transcription factor [Pedobacter sp. G11]